MRWILPLSMTVLLVSLSCQVMFIMRLRHAFRPHSPCQSWHTSPMHLFSSESRQKESKVVEPRYSHGRPPVHVRRWWGQLVIPHLVPCTCIFFRLTFSSVGSLSSSSSTGRDSMACICIWSKAGASSYWRITLHFATGSPNSSSSLGQLLYATKAFLVFSVVVINTSEQYPSFVDMQVKDSPSNRANSWFLTHQRVFRHWHLIGWNTLWVSDWAYTSALTDCCLCDIDSPWWEKS